MPPTFWSTTCTSCASAHLAPRSRSPASTTSPTSTCLTSSTTSTRGSSGVAGWTAFGRRWRSVRPPGGCSGSPGSELGRRSPDRTRSLCIGLNYRDHAAETGQAVPDEPILFTKSPNTLVGPYDDVRIPRGSTKPDWEVELGVVVGRRTSYLESVEAARDAIAGYLVVNDVSERAFQTERGGQWSKGKSAETFNPAGPWLVTPDEIDDVRALDMWLNVNGLRRQTGNTKTMVFDPYFVVYYLSQFLVLEPGDLIDTGTPPGVGMGFTPPIWLQPGDVMELGIEGLGVQRQTVLAPR